jgi:hypothetical protein
MSERPSQNLDGMDVELVLRIDAICRRFEAEWLAGGRPRVADYLAEVPEAGRLALRVELENLERERRGAEAERASRASPPPATVAAAPTLAPAISPTAPLPGQVGSSAHEAATVPSRDQVTVDAVSSEPVPAGATEPARVRYFGTTRFSESWPAAAWALSSTSPPGQPQSPGGPEDDPRRAARR